MCFVLCKQQVYYLVLKKNVSSRVLGNAALLMRIFSTCRDCKPMMKLCSDSIAVVQSKNKGLGPIINMDSLMGEKYTRVITH